MQQHQTLLKSKLPITDQGALTLTQSPQLNLSSVLGNIKSAHLIRLDEINAEGHQAYRQALANVYAALDPNQQARLVYLLDSNHEGVSLYFGMVADTEIQKHRIDFPSAAEAYALFARVKSPNSLELTTAASLEEIEASSKTQTIHLKV